MSKILLATASVLGLIGAVSVPASAQPAMVLRDRLLIVSSETANRLTRRIAEFHSDQRQGAAFPPEVRAVGSNTALDLFCAGVGPATPDIAVTTRRMPRSTAETCRANGVQDIVEIRIGMGALVIAARRGDPIQALTSRQVYEGLAAERASDEGFISNPDQTWADVSPGLPAVPIRFLVPDESSGTRSLFEDLVMEAGCRGVRQIRLLFEAPYRRSKCVTLRADGVIRELDPLDAPAQLLASPPGTLAVLTNTQVLESGGNLVALSLDGISPTAATVASLEYNQTRTVFVYAKRQHARNNQGVGVVRGIHEFLADATAEAMTGPGGMLSGAGLISLQPADREAQRRIAANMTLMTDR